MTLPKRIPYERFEPFQPERFKEAREARGYSLDDLQRRMNAVEPFVMADSHRWPLSAAEIESGAYVPRPAEIRWLGNMLGMPPEFLTKKPSGIDFSNAHIFLCRGRASVKKCAFCPPGKPKACVALCDHFNDPFDPKTCDAPMCGEHRGKHGPELDYCPKHSAAHSR